MFSILKNKRGESSMDTAIALIISVVIGGLVLAIIVGLTNDKVIPSFKESFKKQSTSVVYSEISSTSSETSYQKGDVNKDGTVDENDYKYLERYLNNWPEYDKVDASTADINGDGTVDKKDLTQLDSLINTVRG